MYELTVAFLTVLTFGIYDDARYIPVETKSTVGTTSAVQMNVRPLIVSSGIAWRF